MTWFVTRAEPQAAQMVAELRREQVAALALPCIERAWLPWPPAPEPEACRVLLVTSVAVAHRMPDPDGAIVAALAPATVAELRRRGIPVAIVAPGGVRALVNAVIDWLRKNTAPTDRVTVQYPTSDLAASQAEHRAAIALLEQHPNASVRVFMAYRTHPPTMLAATIRDIGSRHMSCRLGWIFASPSAVQFFAENGGFALPRAAAVVAIGASTATAWSSCAPNNWPRPWLHDQHSTLARTVRRTQLACH
jgi:uroporphyrinogen-III synthase